MCFLLCPVLIWLTMKLSDRSQSAPLFQPSAMTELLQLLLCCLNRKPDRCLELNRALARWDREESTLTDTGLRVVSCLRLLERPLQLLATCMSKNQRLSSIYIVEMWTFLVIFGMCSWAQSRLFLKLICVNVELFFGYLPMHSWV